MLYCEFINDRCYFLTLNQYNGTCGKFRID